MLTKNSHDDPRTKASIHYTSGFSILNYRRENFNPIASKIDYARIQNAFGTIDDLWLLIGYWIDKALKIESTSNAKIQLFVDGKRKDRKGSNFLEQWNKTHGSVESRLSSLNTSLKLANLQIIDPQVRSICLDLSRHHRIPFYCGMSLTPNYHYQFLRKHSDNQKIFIYQLLGNKLWKIYQDERGRDLTILSDHIKHNDTPSFRKIWLYKGEVLDIPVNVVHKAECTGNIPSVHLTFASPHIKDKSDLFHYIFSFAEKRMRKTHNFDDPLSATELSRSFCKDFQESIASLGMNRLILDYKQDRFLEALEIFNKGYKYY